ncbi:hypothetical protein Dimus_002859, partial [Dionaea muscipula]
MRYSLPFNSSHAAVVRADEDHARRCDMLRRLPVRSRLTPPHRRRRSWSAAVAAVCSVTKEKCGY